MPNKSFKSPGLIFDPHLYLFDKRISWCCWWITSIKYSVFYWLGWNFNDVHGDASLQPQRLAQCRGESQQVKSLKKWKKQEKAVNKVAGDEINLFSNTAFQHVLYDLTSGSNTASTISAFHFQLICSWEKARGKWLSDTRRPYIILSWTHNDKILVFMFKNDYCLLQTHKKCFLWKIMAIYI